MSKRSSKPKNSHTQKGLRLAVLFCALVVGIIIFSALIRGTIAVKKSTFGDVKYNVLVESEKSQVVSFSENSEVEEKIRIVSFNDGEGDGIVFPTNAKVESNGSLTLDNFKSKFTADLFKSQNNIPFVDRIKLAIFTLRTDSKEIDVVSASDYSKLQLMDMFKDSGVSDEAKSIEIVNASGVQGLGNRLANVLSTLGANVVLVSGEDEVREKSTIRYKQDSLTTSYLLSYLGFLGEKTNFEAVADVIIILGKDAEGSDRF